MLRSLAAASVALVLGCASGSPATGASSNPGPLRFVVRLAPGVVDGPVTGRLILVLDTHEKGEPREHVTDVDRTAQIFGIEVRDLAAPRPATTHVDLL